MRVGAGLGGDRGAFERIERDVDARAGALRRADLLADVEHRRLVALALADHDGAVDVERVERGAHRLDRGGVGGLLVAAADQLRGGDRGRLGDPNHLQHQDAIENAACLDHISCHPLSANGGVQGRIGKAHDKVENGASWASSRSSAAWRMAAFAQAAGRADEAVAHGSRRPVRDVVAQAARAAPRRTRSSSAAAASRPALPGAAPIASQERAERPGRRRAARPTGCRQHALLGGGARPALQSRPQRDQRRRGRRRRHCWHGVAGIVGGRIDPVRDGLAREQLDARRPAPQATQDRG